MKKHLLVTLAVILCLGLQVQKGWPASGSKLFRIRYGQHTNYSRLVIEFSGAPPIRLGPSTDKGVPIVFEQLQVTGVPDRIFRKIGGAVNRVSLDREDGRSVISVIFKSPGTVVKSFYMEGRPEIKNSKRLVLDVYLAGRPLDGPGKIIVAAAPKAPAKAAAALPTAPTGAAPPIPVTPPVPAGPQAAQAAAAKPQAPPASKPPAQAPIIVQKEAPPSEPVEPQQSKISGQIDLTLRPGISGDDDSAQFTQYRDFNAATGGWSVQGEKDGRYFVQSEGADIGQQDQSVTLRGGMYGKIKLDLNYNEIPHRYAFNTRTLYSGVGSQNMTLDNQLQTNLQGLAGNPVGQANVLIGAYTTAATGDPTVERKALSLKADLVALDPFTFRAEISRETQEGTRPIFGAFGLAHAVELFEPIDYETVDVKFIAEYAHKNKLFNATYNFQQFDNQIDTLTFDNPFRITDVLGGPSQGSMSLAPDNTYHNLSLSGAFMNLPLKSRISATAAWGLMKQDQRLAPFTVNTALTAPFDYTDRNNLPRQSADAQVRTTLYNLSLAAKPVMFMNLKGNVRYYNYENETDSLILSNGYVNSDTDTIVGSLAVPIQTLPLSYEKTKADMDLGFDLAAATRINLTYAYQVTDRTNSEVKTQTDNIYGLALSQRVASWADLRAAYERTQTDIDEYNYEIYLQGGQDLVQLPTLRKYNQANVTRDRIRLSATVYPMESLALGGTLTYGKDDFSDSPHGLTENTYYSASIDADWSLGERLHFNTFYTYEKYENYQLGRGEFDEDNDGIPTVTDWQGIGKDEINTFGLGADYAIIPELLDCGLNYNYTKTDGRLDFIIPIGTVESFDNSDDTTLQTLDVRLTYKIQARYSITVGYIWENFEYDDYSTQGFTLVPVSNTGAYKGALLAGTLPREYDASIVYTKLSLKF